MTVLMTRIITGEDLGFKKSDFSREKGGQKKTRRYSIDSSAKGEKKKRAENRAKRQQKHPRLACRKQGHARGSTPRGGRTKELARVVKTRKFLLAQGLNGDRREIRFRVNGRRKMLVYVQGGRERRDRGNEMEEGGSEQETGFSERRLRKREKEARRQDPSRGGGHHGGNTRTGSYEKWRRHVRARNLKT